MMSMLDKLNTEGGHFIAPFFCREIRADKERQRIIRTGRNKFNTKPKDVSLLSECDTTAQSDKVQVAQRCVQ